MSRDHTGWSGDPSRTQKGIVPPGLVGTPEPEPRQETPYRLGARLGSSGEVYQAESAVDSTPAVVKVFRFASGLDADSVAAFTREVRSVADLRHPHVVQVLQCGTFSDGAPFVVMERLRGETLEERLARREFMAPQEAVPILRGVVSALAAAHRAGIVHRELRADNVFMADLPAYESGFAKVLDFGVSRLTAAARATGRIIGPRTAGSLAPEQRQRSVDAADERTDEYALAALTYRMLTGREISGGSNRTPVFERASSGGAVEKPAAYARCSANVEQVLLKAMNQEPESRFGSVTAFFAALEGAVTENARPEAPGEPGPRPERLADVATKVASTMKGHDVARAESSWPAGPVATESKPAEKYRPRVSPPPRGGASATVRLRAPQGIQPSAPGSLTEQFFLAGEQHEASHRAGPAVDDDDLVDSRPSQPTRFESFHSLPRSRTPVLVAGACGLVALAIVVWALAGKEPDEPAAAKSPPAAPSAQVQEPPSSAERPSPPSSASSAPGAAAGAALPTPNAAAPRGGSATSAVESGAGAAGRSPGEQAPPASGKGPARIAGTGRAEAGDGTAGDGTAKGPLRGYVWSERRRRLVRARAAAVPTDSGPPPPAGQTPSARDLLPPKF